MKLIIYTDGASRGNPGPASYGFVILNAYGKLLYKEGKYLGVTTNNVAEYQAVLESLKYVTKTWNNHKIFVEIFMDSKLVVEQLSGRFKIKSSHLRPVALQIKILSLKLKGVVYSHIPRSQNIEADKMANLALDNRDSSI